MEADEERTAARVLETPWLKAHSIHAEVLPSMIVHRSMSAAGAIRDIATARHDGWKRKQAASFVNVSLDKKNF
eukprot:4324962-Amphidinium_carterae.2